MVHGKPYVSGDKVWVWSREPNKWKKPLDLWEGPYVVIARMSGVSYKMAQQSSPSQGKFLSFDMLKRYADKTVQAEKANERKQPISYWSAKFFDDPELNVEDEAFSKTGGIQP